VLTDDAISTI